MRLSATEVLLVDCQTTGATPERGHLLELAWCRARADAKVSIEPTALIVALPEGASIPRRISKLTGITPADLRRAIPPGEVWRRLLAQASELGDGAPALAVAHFARFEERFLRDLHHRFGGGDPFPFEMICTHEIARRLLPDLPRMGLHALAGYLGRVLGRHKRAAAHVEATAVVWSELAERLEDDGVADMDDLRRWLSSPPPPRPKKRRFPLSREERLALPEAPGVYRMKARDGTVLYVGKATSLKRRFNSYFQKRKHGNTEKILELLTQARKVEVTETASPLEAALLESDEIKRLRPPYNTALMADDDRCWFASLDLTSSAPEPDERHLIGPLPRADSLALMGMIPRWAGTASPSPDELREALGLHESRSVEPGILDAGLKIFHNRHLESAGGAPSIGTGDLLRLGARLWRAWKERDGEDMDEDGESTTDEPREWEPEDVAALLEGVLRGSAGLVRRGHLLCQLTESALVFQPQGAGPEDRRALVIERGRVASARDAVAGAPVPIPPGHRRPWRARQRVIERATYDRLRVLTTELRRLLASGDPVRVRLSPRSELGREALARRLGGF